jgi:hypothetical protein
VTTLINAMPSVDATSGAWNTAPAMPYPIKAVRTGSSGLVASDIVAILCYSSHGF